MVEDAPDAPKKQPSPAALARARRRALRNIAKLDLDSLGKVLGHERYWTRAFVDLFLERCDIHLLDDFPLGKAMAELAPRLARRVGLGYGPDEIASQAERASFWLRAQASWIDALRVSGDAAGCAYAVREAYELCASQRVNRFVLADLHRRRALWRAAHDPAEACLFLDESIQLARELGEMTHRGEAHLARAWMRLVAPRPAGLLDLARAVELCHPRRPRSVAAFTVALDRVLRIVTREPAIAVDEEPESLRTIRRARRRFFNHSTRSPLKARLYWAEALLARRLGVDRHTERRLGMALETFVSLEMGMEAFLASLDLAAFFERHARHGEALQVLGRAEQHLDLERNPADASSVRRVSAREILERGRELLGDSRAFHELRHEATSLLPSTPAPEALLPAPPATGQDPSLLERS